MDRNNKEIIEILIGLYEGDPVVHQVLSFYFQRELHKIEGTRFTEGVDYLFSIRAIEDNLTNILFDLMEYFRKKMADWHNFVLKSLELSTTPIIIERVDESKGREVK